MDGDDLMYGEGGDDFLNGAKGNDRLYGGDDNDTLRGWHGNDRLDGGDGDDTIYGGDGGSIGYLQAGDTDDDYLIGGEGADVFVFGVQFGNDTIQDFSQEDDTINLTALDLSADEFAGVLAAGEATDDGFRLDLTDYNGWTLLLEGISSGMLSVDDFLI